MSWPWVRRSRLDFAHKCLEDQRAIIDEQRTRLLELAGAQVTLALAARMNEQLREELERERVERRRLAGELLVLVDGFTAATTYIGRPYPS